MRPGGPQLRWLVAAVLVAVAGVAGVVLLYDAGWLPIAGPFVALVAAPALVLLGTWWRTRRHQRLTGRAAEQLAGLVAELERERRLPRDDRASGAGDETLDPGLHHARAALARFAAGDDESGARELDALTSVARLWDAGSPAGQGVQGSAALAEQLRTSRDRLEGRRPAGRRPVA